MGPINELRQWVERNPVTETGKKKQFKSTTHVNKMPQIESVDSATLQDTKEMTVQK